MYTNESISLIRHPAFLAFLFLVGVLSPSVSFAGNGPVAPPTIREGQFVYTPDNCTPKGMSQAQQATLNGRLANLHNPFYVVIGGGGYGGSSGSFGGGGFGGSSGSF